MVSVQRKLNRFLRTTALYGASLLVVAPLFSALNALDAAAGDAAPSAGARQVPVENQAYVSPGTVATPTAEAPVAAPLPTPPAPYALPPVDADVKAKAERELSQATPQASSPAPASAAPTPTAEPVQLVSYAPPAPLPANPNPDAVTSAPLPPSDGQHPSISELPKIIFAPLPPKATQNEVASVSMSDGAPLSDDSKRILSGVPSKIGEKVPGKKSNLKVSRETPDLKSLIAKSDAGETFESNSLKIKVQRPGLDTNYELNRAYNTLMAGDSEQAIEIYKNVLNADPENQDALFGVAALYHRQGQLDKARPYYARLLKLNPQHKEGLNNFLALISDEAPEEALAELERLGQRNPEYSPIPAQQAIVLKKLGYLDQARDQMLHAIELSPDSLTYKYNLAVILDQMGDVTNASGLYRLLIDASLKGEKVPAPLETLQKRLNYITANAPKPMPAPPAATSTSG